MGVFVLGACDDYVSTEQRQVSLSLGGLRHGFVFESGDLVLVRSQLCATRDDDPLDLTDPDGAGACFDASLSGPVVAEPDTCLRFSAPGEVEWSLEPRPCESETDVVADRLRFRIVAADEVRALALDWATAVAFDVAGELQPSIAERVLPSPDGIVNVATEEPVDVEMLLVSRDGREVAWSEGIRHTVARSGDADISSGGVQLARGAETEFSLETPAAEFAMPPLRGVSPDTITSLQILAVSKYEGIAVLAVAHNEEGDRVVASPIVWSSPDASVGDVCEAIGGEGEPVAGCRDLAYVQACRPPPAEPQMRRARLRAEVAGVSAEIDYEWIAEPADSDEAWERPEDCPEPGCGCDHRRDNPRLVWLGVVIVAAISRRGRLGRASRPPSGRGRRPSACAAPDRR